jgi:phospholipid-translocating ATPase
MLTGDKVETAKCIAISTGLRSKGQEIFEMVELTNNNETDELHISRRIKQFKGSEMLIIDGGTLTAITSKKELSDEFFNAAKTAKSVCVCRCAPKQKATVASQIKALTGKRIACVGDGGNDVAMIQEGDVGLGIVGKEGK